MREWLRLRLGIGVTVFALAIAAMLVFASDAAAGVAGGSLEKPTGSLPQTGQQLNKTHWKVQAGDTITGTINGVTDAVVGSGWCGAGVSLIIQRSKFGNKPICVTLSGSTRTSTSHMPTTDGCR